jgi:hypothetical protein
MNANAPRDRVGLLAIAIALTVQLNAEQTPAPEAITDPEAYRVYGAVLASDSYRFRPGTTLLVAQDAARLDACDVDLADASPEWAPVIQRFKDENAHPRVVIQDQPLGRSYQVRPSSDLEWRFPGFSVSRWIDLIRRTWVGGYAVVSAVGFDPTRTRAIVSVYQSCGGLCGSGTDWFMIKESGRWREATPAETGDVGRCLVAS